MAVVRPTLETIKNCMSKTVNTRNVCILAHVDHGKTTIADSLLATNRLVSKHMAGFIRYLDDRRDEQERGITMKSSAVSLVYDLTNEGNENLLLLNLIDTPGHIDFSTEVSAALRVSDGAIIVVDLVEGVCAQTREAIKQAFDENTNMILVLNKFDRLIVELHKEVNDIFQIILRVIEDCNALIAELYSFENLSNNEKDIEDANVLFSPELGNVIFASAVDGWGFTLRQMAEMFVNLVKDEDVESLNKKMWNFECYVDSKTKLVKQATNYNRKENLFVQLCLKTIYHVYSTLVIRMERNDVNLILQKLNLKTVTREMNHNDPRVQVRAILQAWKPLAHTIMLQCKNCILSPSNLDDKRICHLLNANQFSEDENLNNCVSSIAIHFKNCSSAFDAPTIVYVSKMFCVSKQNLSQYKPRVFVPPRKPKVNESNGISKEIETNNETKTVEYTEKQKTVDMSDEKPVVIENEEKNVMIALARVFSGTIRVGQEVYLLLPSYNPNEADLTNNVNEYVESTKHIKKVVIRELYILFGRDLILVDSIEAGNICGIGGLEDVIIRTGTLSSTLNCIPLIDSTNLEPIVRNAIEPVNPKDLPKLRHGLRLLMQSDSCVQVIMQESGEHVLLTAGDVHLAKCLEDLKTKFANIEVNVSSPMVPLRETIVHNLKKYNFLDDIINTVKVNFPPFTVSIIAVSVPDDISKVIQENYNLLSLIENHVQKQMSNKSGDVIEKTFSNENTQKAVPRTREKLKNVFNSVCGPWSGLENKIWSVGRMKDNINILFNLDQNFSANIFTFPDKTDTRSFFEQCFKNAFNTICKAGPICEEPLLNCAFIVKSFTVDDQNQSVDLSPQTAANFELTLKGTFREAFTKQNQRLMEPIFTTDIQVNTNILGKVYTVVNKRHGKVLEAVGMDDQEKMFLVKSQIPVIESTGFANEIRKTTSGQAIPNLKFSHYEIIDGDPYVEPVSDDEEDDSSTRIEVGKRAYNLRKDVRRRKGLYIDDEVVVHAEKQRTLNKKK